MFFYFSFLIDIKTYYYYYEYIFQKVLRVELAGSLFITLSTKNFN